MKPTISIRLMCFNQEKYIRQAMDGIFMQKVDFLVEIVVGDDFSSDTTLDIIKSYRETEFIKINILRRKIGGEYWKIRQERGRLYNYLDILRNCNGKYIALLDGDDFWIDPFKLKKQVDFLERNEEFDIVSHEVYTSKYNAPKSIKSFLAIIYQNIKFGGIKSGFKMLYKVLTENQSIWELRVSHPNDVRYNPYTFENILLNKHFMATSSIVIRRKVVDKIGDWFTGTDGGHYFIVLIALSRGKGYHFRDFMGHHRLHENSISQDAERLKKLRPLRKQHRIYRLDCLLRVTDRSLHDVIHRQINIEKQN